jgi:hypothetical protein
MKKTCAHCQTTFVGRADKRFCSIDCKNSFNNQLRKNTKDITQEIDTYLHRNREILKILTGKAYKITLDKLLLVRAGFRFEYMTGVYFNKEQKMYRLVYDYAWMDFTDQKVLIVQKSKTL